MKKIAATKLTAFKRNHKKESMKKTRFIIVTAIVAVLGVATLLVTGCSGSGHNDHMTQSGDPPAQKSEKAVQYTCSMHPEVVQDKPGDCPKCGMKLVEKR
jgi:Cu(I)/Ag(I) efflux system membrane fusion protein